MNAQPQRTERTLADLAESAGLIQRAGTIIVTNDCEPLTETDLRQLAAIFAAEMP